MVKFLLRILLPVILDDKWYLLRRMTKGKLMLKRIEIMI